MAFFGNRKGVSPNSGGDGGVFSINDEYRMQQLGTIYDAPGKYVAPEGASGSPDGHTATGGSISDWVDTPGAVYRTHIFQNSGTFTISGLSGTYPAI